MMDTMHSIETIDSFLFQKNEETRIRLLNNGYNVMYEVSSKLHRTINTTILPCSIPNPALCVLVPLVQDFLLENGLSNEPIHIVLDVRTGWVWQGILTKTRCIPTGPVRRKILNIAPEVNRHTARHDTINNIDDDVVAFLGSIK